VKYAASLLLACMMPVSAQQAAYFGSVPAEEATGAVLDLTLNDAVARGLKHNLGTVLAGEDRTTARAQRIVAVSQLLPNINARVLESSQQINLAAFGFTSFPGIAPIVGPFGLFDARGTASQTILNLRALHGVKASTQLQKAADLSYQDSRDIVAFVVTQLYLQAAASSSRIETTQAQLAVAESLFQQATDQKKAGVVPGIDVLRAQVQVQAERHRVIAAKNDFEKNKLNLGRVIGLPEAQEIRLADGMPQSAQPALTFDEALAKAYESRADYQSLAARVRAAELNLKAARAGYLPTVGFAGDYGTIGPSPVNMHGTFTAGVAVNIPIFQGNRVKGEVLQADAELVKQRAQLDEVRGRIAFEIRSSQLDLKAAAEQVDVSKAAVGLAKQQEEQARDRFAAGVTNNLEVVQAQESLAAANDSLIASLFAYNLARVQLERAIGGVEKNIGTLFQGVKR